MATTPSFSERTFDRFDAFIDLSADSLDVAQRYVGTKAYRYFKIVQNLPVKNAAANFRGMVLNKEAGVAYHHIGRVGAMADHFGMFLAVASELHRSASSFRRIAAMNTDTRTKVQMAAFETSAIGLRLFAKVGTGFIGAASIAARADSYINPACWIGSCQPERDLANRLETVETYLNSTVDQTYTGEHVSAVVTHVLSLAIH